MPYTRDGNVLLRDAVLASCAAPMYFDPKAVEPYLLVGGGLWANNPSIIALTEAMSTFNKPIEQVRVQQPSSDPHIESFDDHDLSGLGQEVPAVIERARASWEEAPKHPAYGRPAPPARRRNRREQGSAQASTAEGEAAEA